MNYIPKWFNILDISCIFFSKLMGGDVRKIVKIMLSTISVDLNKIKETDMV